MQRQEEAPILIQHHEEEEAIHTQHQLVKTHTPQQGVTDSQNLMGMGEAALVGLAVNLLMVGMQAHVEVVMVKLLEVQGMDMGHHSLLVAVLSFSKKKKVLLAYTDEIQAVD